MKKAFNPFTGKLDLYGMTPEQQAAYFKLDQTTPQTVTGLPFFQGGIKFGDGIHFGSGYDFVFTNDGYATVAGTISETTNQFTWNAPLQAKKLLVDGEVLTVTCSEVVNGSGYFNVTGSGFSYFSHDYVIYAYVYDGTYTAYNITPYPISVADGSGNAGEVVLTWDAPVGATGYILWENTNGVYVDVGNVNYFSHADFSGWTSGAPTLSPQTPLIVSQDLAYLSNSQGASFVVNGVGDLTSTGRFYGADGSREFPEFSFGSQPDMGMYRKTFNSLVFAFGGYERVIIDGTSLSTNNSLTFRSSGVGTAALPSYSWATDTNNGMLLPTTDTIAFSTAGTERLRISSAGLLTSTIASGAGDWMEFKSGATTMMKLRYYGSSPWEEFEFYIPKSNAGMNFKTDSGGIRIVPWTIGGADTLFFQATNQDFTFSSGGGVPGRLVTFSFANASFTKASVGSPTITTANLNVGTYFSVSNASSGMFMFNFGGSNYFQTGLTFAGGGEVAPLIFSGTQGYPQLLYMSSTKTYTPQDFGAGTTAPSARLHVVKTTEQIRVGYDDSNYWKGTVGSTGGLTLAGVGTGGALTITPTAGQNVNLSLSGTGDFAVNTNQFYVDTSSGNIGIGTASPSSVAARYIHIYNAGSAGYSFQNDVRQWSFFVQGTTGNYGLYNHSTSSYALMFDGSNKITTSLTLDEAKDLAFGTTTGTKIGTGATQKLAFFGATPVVRQAHIADAKANYAAGELDTEAEVITAINATNTIINSILARLETFGLSATS